MQKHVNIPCFAIFSPIHDEPIKFAICTQETTPEKMVMHVTMVGLEWSLEKWPYSGKELGLCASTCSKI